MESVYSVMQDDICSLLRIGKSAVQLGRLHSEESTVMHVVSSDLQYEGFPVQSENSEMQSENSEMQSVISVCPRGAGLHPSAPLTEPGISTLQPDHKNQALQSGTSSMHCDSLKTGSACSLLGFRSNPGTSHAILPMQYENSRMELCTVDLHPGSSKIHLGNSLIYPDDLSVHSDHSPKIIGSSANHFYISPIQLENNAMQLGHPEKHCEHLEKHRTRSEMHPGNSEMHPGSSEMHLESSEMHPGSTEMHPGNSSMHPESSLMHYGSSSMHHGSSSMHPESSIMHHGSSIMHHGSSSMHPESSSMHPGSSSMHPGTSEIHPESTVMHPGRISMHPVIYLGSPEKPNGSSIVDRESSAIHLVSPGLYPGSSMIDPGRPSKYAECTMWNPEHFSISREDIYNQNSEKVQNEISTMYCRNLSNPNSRLAMNNDVSAIEVGITEIPPESSSILFENSTKPEYFRMPPQNSEVQTVGSDVSTNALPKSSSTQIGNEILHRNPRNNHELSVDFVLENFSGLPHYLFKKDCSLCQDCSLTWDIEVMLRRNTRRSSCIDLQVKLFKNGNERGIFRTNLRIVLCDSSTQILYDSVFSSLCSSEYLPSTSWIAVVLHQNTLYPLSDDKLNVCLVLKVNDCCLRNDIPETKDNDDGDTFNMLSLNFQKDMRTAFESKLLNDICLVVGVETYEVNKFVICARSPVFNNLFGLGSQPHTFYRLNPVFKSKEVMNAFILYLYSGLIGDNLDMDTTCGLYVVAKEFDILALSPACGHMMLSKLTPENACKVLILVHQHRDVFLKDSALRFIKKNITAVEVSSDWRFLSRNLPVLKSEVLSYFMTS